MCLFQGWFSSGRNLFPPGQWKKLVKTGRNLDEMEEMEKIMVSDILQLSMS